MYSLTDELSVWVFEITRDTLYNPSNLHWYSGLKFRCNSKDRVGKLRLNLQNFMDYNSKEKQNSIIGKNVNFFMYFTSICKSKICIYFPILSCPPPEFYLLKQWASWPPDILTSLQILLAEPFLSLRFPVYSLYMRRECRQTPWPDTAGCSTIAWSLWSVKNKLPLDKWKRSPEEGNSH